MGDTSKLTARYDTSVDIKKEKKICQIYKSFFFISSELTSCPAPPRAPGFGACVAPKVFSFFFDSKKEHQIPNASRSDLNIKLNNATWNE